MGSGKSKPPKNEVQPLQALNSQNQRETSTQHDRNVHTDGRETSGNVPDALPMDTSHGMQTTSNSSPSSGPTPVTTRKELESSEYSMNHEKRGMAIIINNKTFEPHLGLSVRTGTDVDGNALLSTFNAMGFDVKTYTNQTVQGMMKILYDASKAYDYHIKSDCFMCAILTHGDEGDVLYGTDDKADFKSILGLFKGDVCRGLVGKPKLFFIQACQGKKADEGVAIDVADSKAFMPEISTKKIPIEADILRAHSSVPGYSAWRHEKKGSWFIQALTEMLNKNWMEMDLLTMLTRVNQMVARKMTETEEMQIPMFTSTLTKDVFFRPKES